MGIMEVATLGAGAIGVLGGAYAANKAANAQTDAANQANATQLHMFNTQNELNAPFREIGLAGQNELARRLGLSGDRSSAGYGSLMQDFGASDFQADPGYAFRLKEGQRALEQSAAARGGLLSGNTGKALAKYGQEAGSQEYQNAFNRYQVNRGNKLNALQSIGGMGQSASNQMAGAAQNYGQSVGQNQLQAGNARASGYMGTANALTNSLNSGLNYYGQRQMANALGGYGGGGSQYYTEEL